MKRQRLYIVTLGCPKNEADSEVLAGEFLRGGYTLTDEPDQANILLINTCGFIEDAKRESIDAVLEAVEMKKKRPDLKVVVWGCLSERYRNEIGFEIPEVDAWFGVEPFESMGRFFMGETYRFSAGKVNRPQLSHPPHSAYLKIADGCDHACTFCAIPLIKGRYRSREPGDLIAESRYLTERGVKELILVAQDTTAWGKDLDPPQDITALLSRLSEEAGGLDWIRVMYTHPSHIRDDFLRIMAENETICRYLDMPLQHASDPMLKRMGRGWTRDRLKDLIVKVRDRVPGVTLRTAFIVGFPGETEAMFQTLLDFVEWARFERLGAFVYSAEEDTPAFGYGDPVPRGLARERYARLMELQRGIAEEINDGLVGQILPVLVDGYDEMRSCSYGRTEGDCPEIDQTVWIEGRCEPGSRIPVEIGSASEYDLSGRPSTS